MKKKTLAMLLALCMMFSLLPFGAAAAGFDDVKSGAYYYDAMRWAVENGIDLGTTEITFSPKASCSRVSTVTFLYRTLTGLGLLPH